MSLLGDAYSVDYTYTKPNQNSSKKKKNASKQTSIDDESNMTPGMLLLDDTFSLGRELDELEEVTTEDDFSVTDSMPRIPESLPTGKEKMEPVDEDVTVTDSMPTGKVKRGYVDDDIIVTDSMSRISDSLSTDTDFLNTSRNSLQDAREGSLIFDTLSTDMSFNNVYDSGGQESRYSKWELESSIPTSDGSSVTQFEVTVSKGILGLSLEDSSDGAPVVTSLRSTSALSGKVRSGDWLIKLDGRDVTSMPATKVVHLITAKKDQKVRRLVFARTSDGSDGDEETMYEA